METGLANSHLFFGIDERLGKGFNLLFRSFEDMKSETLCRLWPNAGETLELFNETG